MIWIWKFSHHRFETSTVIAILILVFVALDKKDILLIGAIQKICTQRFFHFMTTIPPLTLSINIIFFSVRVFFHGHWRLMRQQGKGEDHFLFHSTTSTRSRTFRHLFATLHVRWHHIFLIAPLVFTRLLLDEIFTLSNYHLIDWWCEVCFSLFTWWFDTRFLLQQSWCRKPVGSNLHRLSPLYYKQTD